MDRRSDNGGRPGGAAGNGAAGSARPAFEALGELKSRLGEIFEHLSFLASAKIDSAALSARKKVLLAAAGVVGLFTALGIATAFGVLMSVLFLRGLAGGLGALFGGRPWLGELAVGGLFFLALGAGLFLGLKKLRKATLKKLVEKYEKRKSAQRERFGRSVEDQARAAGSS